MPIDAAWISNNHGKTFQQAFAFGSSAQRVV
jgi:hypothetical protein